MNFFTVRSAKIKKKTGNNLFINTYYFSCYKKSVF